MAKIDADARQIKDMGRAEKSIAEPYGRHAGDGDRRDRPHGKMPENSLMRKNNSGNRCIEPGGDRTGHPAADKYIGAQRTACGLPQKASHRRTKMHQRSVLTDRSTATSRDKSGQG